MSCVPLSDAKRAELYNDLHRLLAAGLPVSRALESVTSSVTPRLQSSLQRATLQVKQGKSLVVALSYAKFASDRDLALLGAAEMAGRSEAVFAELSQSYQSRARRAGAVKANMMYLLAVIMLAVFVAPLPALMSGAMGTGAYISRTFLPLLVMAVGVQIGLLMLAKYRQNGYPRAIAVLALQLPVCGTFVRLRERVDLLSALASLLMSGVAAFQAFERAARLTRNPVSRAAYQRGETQLKLGASVADALLEANVLTADEGYPLVSTGEMAGRLDQSLLDQRGHDNAALESGLESVATWLPRVVYVLALGTVAGSIWS